MIKLTQCWRNFHGDNRTKQILFGLRCLHKSTTSRTVGIAGEESIPERLITSKDAAAKKLPKTLAEMPGPGTVSNLFEFFCKDGFSRIHEIQVRFVKFFFTLLFFVKKRKERESISSILSLKPPPPRLLLKHVKKSFLEELNLINA